MASAGPKEVKARPALLRQIQPVSEGRFVFLVWIFALYATVLLAGVLCAFHPTLLSGGTRIQTDPADTLFNHYVLEHSWLWVSRPGYAGTFWSPPCFYPARLTLAYSENLLGTAPVYWLYRSALGPPMAYAAWMITVCSLTYATTALALRCLGVAHGFAAFGAFVFAFGLPRMVNLCHHQLLPHLFAPLAVCATWCFLTRPRLPTLAGLLAACLLQALSSIYLGWFLLLALAIFIPCLLATHRNCWPQLVHFSRRSWVPVAGMLAATTLFFAVFLIPYREANRGFVRDWQECTPHMPKVRDWLLPPPVGATARWLSIDCGTPNLECWCFPGWVVLALAGLGAVLAICRPRLLGAERARVVLALLATALTLAVLSLADVRDGLLWRFVYDHVPGAMAIRAVGRVGLTVLLFALAGGLLTLDALTRVPGTSKRWRWTVAGVVLLLGALEQIDLELPSFDVSSFYPHAEALGKRLQRGTASYILSRPEIPWYTGELLAMWAGLYSNRPVINGYSGRWPDRYPYPRMQPGVVFGWLAFNTPPGELWPGRLLYVVPVRDKEDEYRTVMLEATRGDSPLRLPAGTRHAGGFAHDYKEEPKARSAAPRDTDCRSYDSRQVVHDPRGTTVQSPVTFTSGVDAR
jgi:hypothetical protein